MQVQPVDILLVEDNSADVELTREALKEWRILNRLHVVKDGVDALDFLNGRSPYEEAPRPDILLLDLNLPRKDGREVLAEIKADRVLKTIPVVVLSTSDAEMDVIKSYGLGANCYVVKPLGIEKFIDVLKAVGEFWFTVVKLPSSELVAQYRWALHATPELILRPSGALELIRVLVIDESEAGVDLVQRLLQGVSRPRFEVHSCHRLSSALSFMRSQSVDVILLSLNLPDSRGVQTFKEISSEFLVPIVINASDTEESDVMAAMHLGAQDLIQKNEREAHLISRILRHAIEKKWMEEDQSALILRERSAREEAERAILARDEFLGIASHELKTPLTSLQMQSELLNGLLLKQLRDQLPPTVLRLLEGVQQQTERLGRLVRSLLDISRINAGKLLLELSEVDLSELVQEVIHNHQSQLEESQCSMVFHPQVGIIGYWDRYRIDQVITNLLTNAMKYGRGKPIEIQVEKADTCARLRVIDHGRGLKKEEFSLIFGRFQRASGSQGVPGLGLGLYIARQILDAHQGRIRVESELGRGTVFTVELPLQQSRGSSPDE